MPDSNVLVRMPIAVFALAYRKSIQNVTVWPCSHRDPCGLPYIYNLQSGSNPFVLSDPVRIPPVKSCRWWRRFSPQIRFNRFVFLILPILSLEVHLDLTTSSHTPFPAGYVTLPMCNRSPPLRLMLSHSRELASSSFPPILFWMHSRHAQASTATSLIAFEGWAHRR